MAIIRPGSVVGGISGKLGGLVFVVGRRGTVVRPRPNPVKKETTFSLLSRGRMSTLRQFWSTMTQLQRDAWQTAAVQILTTNALGVSSPMSGFTYFILTNKHGVIDSPDIFPAPRDLDPRDFAVNPSATFSASGTFSCQIDNPFPPITFLRIDVFGWPFWRTTPSKTVPRLVFLDGTTSSGDPIVLNVRPAWIQHFGDMVQGQQFAVAIRARFTASPFSPTTVFRQAVTA